MFYVIRHASKFQLHAQTQALKLAVDHMHLCLNLQNTHMQVCALRTLIIFSQRFIQNRGNPLLL